MNKILSFLVVFLITISSVLSAGNLTVTNTNPSPGNPGATVTGSLTVRNSGTDTISGITFVKSDLALNSDPNTKILSSSINFNPASLSNLAAGASSLIASNVVIPSSAKPGLYTGNVEVRGTDTSSILQSTIFTLTVDVNNFPQLDIDTFTDVNPLTITGEQGQRATGTFVLKNTGNIALSNLGITHNVVLTDNDGDNVTLTFAGLPATLNSGSTVTVTVNADISNDVDFNTYAGIVTVKDLVQNVQKTFRLEIKVEPKVCEKGIRSDSKPGGDNLRVNIREPKSSNKFAPGEDISLRVNVKNNWNSKTDVIVSSFLFDLDDNEILVDADTESITISQGNSEDFESILKIPNDITTGHKFALFVKAYEEDDEERNCGEERQDVDIRRDKHSVIINKITFSPSTLACGDTFDAVAELLNIGTTKEDDITLKLINNELNIDLLSNTLTLDKFDNSNDKTTVRFNSIKVPETAQQKQYQFEALLSYNNGDKTESKFGTLTINKCDTTPGTVGENRKASLEVLTSSISVQGGESISIPVTVTNTDKVQSQYIVELQNAQDFSETLVVPKTLTLNPGQSETVYFNLVTKASLNQGKYTGNVVVRSGNNVIDTKAVTITAQSSSLFSLENLNISKIFWIVADIILVIIAIFFIKLIFGKKNKTE